MKIASGVCQPIICLSSSTIKVHMIKIKKIMTKMYNSWKEYIGKSATHWVVGMVGYFVGFNIIWHGGIYIVKAVMFYNENLQNLSG